MQIALRIEKIELLFTRTEKNYYFCGDNNREIFEILLLINCLLEIIPKVKGTTTDRILTFHFVLLEMIPKTKVNYNHFFQPNQE